MNSNTQETLLILMEECAEVTQAVSKCLRFGLDNSKPGVDLTNLQHLEAEIGDLLCMIDLLQEDGQLNTGNINAAKIAKLQKLKTWSSVITAK